MKNPVRVRFAPSPTGPLHIGGVRTALYNYLFARKNSGKIILRIEDTDQNRFVEGAEEYIVQSLSWAGIEFDEGVHVGGPFAPYKQSERKDIYKKYAQQLIESGHAYYAFDTPEELESLRTEYQSQKQNFQYDTSSRKGLKNSLNMSQEELKNALDSGMPYVVRFLIPENEIVVFNDLIRGRVEFNSSQLDDKVIFKSEGMPTYHLANVVDDFLMQISHVIRGEEWLPSAPLHLLLYKSLGWEAHMPLFAHLPLLLKPEGNGKLSKRDGDRLGFPVFPLKWTDPITNEISSGFKEAGYFHDAFINMLALLGWNPGTEQEIFTMDELIKAFSLERISKAGAKFSPEKSKWFNHQYLINKSNQEIAQLFNEELKKKNINANFELIQNVVKLVKERINFVHELWEDSYFFFERPNEVDENIIQKKCNKNTPLILDEIVGLLQNTSFSDVKLISEAIHTYMLDKNLSPAQIMPVLRLCLVGALKGPDVFEIMSILKKDEVLFRIQFFKNLIDNIL